MENALVMASASHLPLALLVVKHRVTVDFAAASGLALER
jgi:hypothetical protein